MTVLGNVCKDGFNNKLTTFFFKSSEIGIVFSKLENSTRY